MGATASNAAGAMPDSDSIRDAIETARNRLMSLLRPEGFWEGHLSSSALSTATAVSAMSLAHAQKNMPADFEKIQSGVAWLLQHQNSDGGWGDTTDSPSNLATTLLTVAACKLADAVDAAVPSAPLDRALQCAAKISNVPQFDSKSMVAAIRQAYGADRTFAVPILMNCALAGMVSWSEVPQLPFELAIMPHGCYKALRLHVVSYALPALIAIGLTIDHHHPPRSKLLRGIRHAVVSRVLKKLERLQPDHGGFLDAAPLTSFVAMGLISRFGPEQLVAVRCLAFLRQSQREDGSWPIDTNLAVWVTTSAVVALREAGFPESFDQDQTIRWIAARQYAKIHPFTNAAPGGWGWTHLAGGVPDADDTSGAMLAILGQEDSALFQNAMTAGTNWLLDLQNSDGGWPTFCRGWGKLPFDQSAPDLTAHVLRALACASPETRQSQNKASNSQLSKAVRRGLAYLERIQQSDGSWVPLWFGNQRTPGQTNPVVGTSFVLRALEILDHDGQQAAKGIEYLCKMQNSDGGWGGSLKTPSSVEETALAVAALAGWRQIPTLHLPLSRGIRYLLEMLKNPDVPPAAIGLYFSRLWYSEQLYPLIWTIEALARAATR